MSVQSDLLKKLMTHTSDDAVEFASQLAATMDPTVIPAILDAVERPENHDVQGPLLQALIALDCGAHLARLADVMRHEGYEVKFMAVNVMESIAAPVPVAEKAAALETLRRLRDEGDSLPQDEWNMIDYALQLIERLEAR